MVMINVSYDELKHYLGKDISLEDLGSALFDLGFELDDHQGDDLAVEITPERLDVISVVGLARVLKSYFGLSEPPTYTVFESDYVVEVTEEVKDVRPLTVCAVIKNLHLDEQKLQSIIDVQEKLHNTLARKRARGAIGIYPLDAIKFPVKFTAAPPGQIVFKPLGSDRLMNGVELITEHETAKEYAYLLEGKKKFPYFVDADNQVLSIPPLINSETTGKVTVDSKDLFIECSGHEQLLLDQLLTNLVTMFSDMGGEIFQVSVKQGSESRTTPDLNPIKRSFTLASLPKYIGIELSEDVVEKHLSQMMYTVIEKESPSSEELTFGDVALSTKYTVEAPAFRADLWHEIDVVDDIARAYGYNNIELQLPQVTSIGSTLPLSSLREELSNVLTGFGFLETYTFSLTGKQEQLYNMQLDDKEPVVSIANGNEVQTMLRISLIPQQLTSLVHNKKNPLPQKLFEGAFVISPDDSKDVKARNELHLSALITDKVVTFTQIRQILDATLSTRGIEVDVKATSHPSFIDGRCGLVMFNGEPIGMVGELHPQVLVNFGLSTPVACFEINLEKFV